MLEAEAVSEVFEAMAGLFLSRTLLLAPAPLRLTAAPLRRTVRDVELLWGDKPKAFYKKNKKTKKNTEYCYFQVTTHITSIFTSEVY